MFLLLVLTWIFLPLHTSACPFDSSGNNPGFSEPGDSCGAMSEITLGTGSLLEDHTLVGYRSMGQVRALRLVYSSLRADPRPIIIGVFRIPEGRAIPSSLSYSLEIVDLSEGERLFVDTSRLTRGPSYAVVQPAQVDATALDTGLYPYRLHQFADESQDVIEGMMRVENERDSPFGTGWTLDGVDRLHVLADGSVLLITGYGGARHFHVASSGTFTAPQGEFSSLRRNDDGSYTRRLTDGTQVHFDAQGLQTAVVDRNGNATIYAYEALT
jgi:hypothetical protein